MPTTDGGFPYPGDNDRPDVPADLQALAEAVDGRLDNNAIWVGQVTITFQNVATASATIAFPAGLFASPPRLLITCANTTVPVVGYHETATTTSCLIRGWSPTSLNVARVMTVLAIGPKA